MNPYKIKNEEQFEVIQRKAPLLRAGHPVSYLTVPQCSVLDPYKCNPYFFPTTRMENGIYKPYGGGFYATQFTKKYWNKENF
jgi:hypothetical protein